MGEKTGFRGTMLGLVPENRCRVVFRGGVFFPGLPARFSTELACPMGVSCLHLALGNAGIRWFSSSSALVPYCVLTRVYTIETWNPGVVAHRIAPEMSCQTRQGRRLGRCGLRLLVS